MRECVYRIITARKSGHGMVYCLKTTVAGDSVSTKRSHGTGIAGAIPRSPQLQRQVMFASLGLCHKSEEYAKSCVRKSVCLYSQSGAAEYWCAYVVAANM